MDKHTKEPWRVGDRIKSGVLKGEIVIEDQYGECIAHVYEGGSDDEGDARRIVACVNACAGYTTELLEQEGQGCMDKMIRHALGAVETLEQQRDELLSALRITRGNVASLGPAGALEPYAPYREWLAQIDSVIAKAEAQ